MPPHIVNVRRQMVYLDCQYIAHRLSLLTILPDNKDYFDELASMAALMVPSLRR